MPLFMIRPIILNNGICPILKRRPKAAFGLPLMGVVNNYFGENLIYADKATDMDALNASDAPAKVQIND